MSSDARLPLRSSRSLPVTLTDAEGRSRETLLYDVSPGPVPIVDQKLIVGLEKWRGLVPAGNGLSGRSPADIPLVDNRRKRFVYLSTISSNQTRLGLYN